MLPSWQQGDVLDDVSFVGLCRPSPLSPKRKVLGGALADTAVGCSLYTEKETFGKGFLSRFPSVVLVRRDARVISTWCVSLGKGELSREERLSV